MTPDEAVFSSHTKLASFVWAVSQNQWQIIKTEWPYVYVKFPAKRQTGEKDEYVFRFELSNYPATAPTACPWQTDLSCPLPQAFWPNGGPQIAAVFNPGWKSNALYIACDREAMTGHENWKSEHPEVWWTPDKSIDVYLKELYELLNHRDYSGPRGA